jgi:hypothetical protein
MKRNIKNFSTPVLDFITRLSFNINNIYLMGTMSERELQFPSDYDLFEKIKTEYKLKTDALTFYEKGLKNIVENLLNDTDCYISGLMLGLENDKPKKWDAKDFLNQNLKPYIEQNSMIKIDTIKLIDGIYSDFSCVYQFFNNDKKINNFELFKPDDLNKDIKKFKQEKNYFKMAKRIYTLTGNEKLITLFNSNLGKMSQIISNIETIIFMLEHNRVSLKNIQNEINIIINKLSSIDDEEFLSREKQIVNKLKQIGDYKNERKNYNYIVKILNTLNNFLFKILQKNTKVWLKENKIN